MRNDSRMAIVVLTNSDTGQAAENIGNKLQDLLIQAESQDAPTLALITAMLMRLAYFALEPV